MEIIPIVSNRFVKTEDLNQHGTLYAAKMAAWFIETGLMAASVYLPSQSIVCAQVHGMSLKHPVKLGQTAQFIGKIVYAGKSSLIGHVGLSVNGQEIMGGFITFVHVDEEGRACPHGLEIQATAPEDAALQGQALQLRAHRP